jgi:hypothetical protein
MQYSDVTDTNARPQPNGGWLMTGPRGNRGGRSLRRDVRELCANHFADAIPKLVEMASGRVQVLLGYATSRNSRNTSSS